MKLDMPEPLPISFLLLFSLKNLSLVIFLSFSLKLIHLDLVWWNPIIHLDLVWWNPIIHLDLVWWNPIHLVPPSHDLLPSQNQINPTTITHVYIYFPPCSSLIYLLSLDLFFPLCLFTFSISLSISSIAKMKKTHKNIWSDEVLLLIKNEILSLNPL